MSGPELRYVELTKDKITMPLHAYRIREGNYGIAQYSDDRPFLVTCGLSACKGIAFVNEEARRGLLGHLSVVNDLEKVIAGLVQRFHTPLSQSDVYLVFGDKQAENVWFGPWGGNWPTIDDLIKEVSKHNPRILIVDNQQYTGIRGIALNLGNGELKEIDGFNGWTFSRQHDISINRRIAELDIIRF